MKWGRKKSQGLPQHIFSISWLPKLKQRTTEKPKCHSANAMQKSRRKSPQGPSSPVCFRWAQHTQGSHSFHDGSVPRHPALRENLDRTGSKVSHFEFPEDGFLQFCFRKQSHECEEGKEPHDFLCFSSDSCRSNCNFTGSEPSCRMLESQKVSGILSDIRTTKSKKREDQTETEFKRLPTIATKEWKLRKAEKRNLEDAEKRMNYWKELKEEQKTSGPTLGKASDFDSERFYHMNEIKSLNSRKSSQRGLVDKPGISSNSIQGFADSQMIKALMLKGEKQRSRVTKSHHGNGETQQRKSRRMSKNRTLSPRTVSRIEICKIRALENLKVAREKRHAELMRAFERLAVVKCSFDPQEDFRESMMEMIIENRIQQPNELETLLACYLSLNSEESHDIIVKVFRQVWFDLNPCICELYTED